jgi:cysteine sulfinate desulfinase/cysteine desulfurase-like protein
VIEADGVYASAGSACHSHKQESSDAKEKNPEGREEHITISHVLAAMHVAPEFAKGTLRLSVGRSTTQEEVLHAANAIHKAIQQLM